MSVSEVRYSLILLNFFKSITYWYEWIGFSLSFVFKNKKPIFFRKGFTIQQITKSDFVQQRRHLKFLSLWLRHKGEKKHLLDDMSSTIFLWPSIVQFLDLSWLFYFHKQPLMFRVTTYCFWLENIVCVWIQMGSVEWLALVGHYL